MPPIYSTLNSILSQVDASVAAQELSGMKWGPTKLPIFNNILIILYLSSPSQAIYLPITEWLIKSAKIPIDSTYRSVRH